MDRYASITQEFLGNVLKKFLLSGSDQEKTFGPTISGLIQRHMDSDRVCLWDTKKRDGRPDTMKLLKEIYESWNAEGESLV